MLLDHVLTIPGSNRYLGAMSALVTPSPAPLAAAKNAEHVIKVTARPISSQVRKPRPMAKPMGNRHAAKQLIVSSYGYCSNLFT